MTKLETKNLTGLTPTEPVLDPAVPEIEDAPEVTIGQLPEVIAKDGRGSNSAVWNRNIVAAALEMVAGGATATSVGKRLGFTQPTWSRWVLTVPGLAKLWNLARQRASHALFDEAIDTARRNAAAPVNEVKNSAIRTLIETLKWGAARLNPESYGEKAAPGASVAITINTTLPLGGGHVPYGMAASMASQNIIDIEPANREYKITATLPEVGPEPGIIDAPQPRQTATPASTIRMRNRRAQQAREKDAKEPGGDN